MSGHHKGQVWFPVKPEFFQVPFILVLSNAPTNSCMALLSVSLFCFILFCSLSVVMLLYSIVMWKQYNIQVYNAMRKFVGGIGQPSLLFNHLGCLFNCGDLFPLPYNYLSPVQNMSYFIYFHSLWTSFGLQTLSVSMNNMGNVCLIKFVLHAKAPLQRGNEGGRGHFA